MLKFKNNQHGGNSNDFPNGGFPPIYLCDKNSIVADENKNREYSTVKTSVSIKDILSKRRDATPFINI